MNKIYVCGPASVEQTKLDWALQMFKKEIEIKKNIIEFSQDSENIPDNILHMYIVVHTETPEEEKMIWKEYYNRVENSGKNVVWVER